MSNVDQFHFFSRKYAGLSSNPKDTHRANIELKSPSAPLQKPAPPDQKPPPLVNQTPPIVNAQ